MSTICQRWYFRRSPIAARKVRFDLFENQRKSAQVQYALFAASDHQHLCRDWQEGRRLQRWLNQRRALEGCSIECDAMRCSFGNDSIRECTAGLVEVRKVEQCPFRVTDFLVPRLMPLPESTTSLVSDNMVKLAVADHAYSDGGRFDLKGIEARATTLKGWG